MRVRRLQRWLTGVLGAAALLLVSARAEDGSATRSGPAQFSPGETLSLRLLLAPLADTVLHAVTETLPPGVEFVSADNGALYAPATRQLRWGVFFDGRVRTLNYRVRVLTNAPVALAWHGVATFDAAEIPVTGLPETLRRGAAAGTVRRTLPADFRGGQSFTVRLDVTPDATIGFHAVDEGVPAGWTVSELNLGGIVGADDRLKWGPFPDGDRRELTYVLTPPTGATEGRFTGRGLFGELEVTAIGPEMLRVRPTGGGQLQRQLPAGYRVGRPVEVTLRVEPDPAVSLFAVLETVPAGWTILDAPGAAAVNAGAGKIRWGPFVEPLVRELTYRVLPAAEATGSVNFAGSADFDAVTVPTTGSAELAPLALTPTVATRQLPETFRPGQRLAVQVIVAPGEGVEAYGVQENLPAGWTVETAVGAGVEGSRLTWGPFFDGSPRSFTYEVRAPLGTGVPATFAGGVAVNGGTVPIAGPDTVQPAPPPSGRVTRTLPPDFVPGNLFSVTNRVVPDAGVTFNVMAESVPPGWAVVQALPEGVFDAAAGQYKWGPFTDDVTRLLVLTLRSPTNAGPVVTFAGSGTFAGVEKATTGTAAVPRNLPPTLSAVGDQFVLEDEPLALRLAARDDLLLGPHLELVIEAEPAGLFPAAGFEQIVEGNTRIIVLTPAFEAAGLATIRLALGDGTHVTRRQFRVAVTAQNDAPRFDLPVVAEAALEDGGPVTLAGFQIHDDDAGEAPLTLTLTAAGGTLLLPAEPGSVQRLDDDSDPARLRLLGSQSELNAVLTRLRVQPAPDFFGDLLLTFEATDGGERGPGGVQTGRADWVLPVLPVNDPPVTAPPPTAELTVNEDAPLTATRFSGWLPGLAVGPINEATAGQALLSEVSVSAPALFRQLPRFAADGTLSFQLAPDANGETQVRYWFRDTGGRANGGRDASATNLFRLVVRPVNDPPLAAVTNRTELVLTEDALAAATRFPGWLRGVVAGPADEVAAGQRTQTVFSVEPPELFRQSPRFGNDGTLHFELAPDRFGEAVIRYHFEDDGGTAEGGSNRSATNLVVLTVNGVNDPPSALLPPRLSVRADVGPVEVTLRGVSSGRFETATDGISLAASVVSVSPAGLLASNGVSLVAYSGTAGALTVRFVPAVSVSTSGEFHLRLADGHGAFTDYSVPLRLVVGTAPPEPVVPLPAEWANADTATGLPRIELDEDEPARELDLAGLFRATDGQALRFSVVTNTAGEVLDTTIAGSRLRLTPRPDQHGEGLVLLVAENDDYTVEFPFVVSVKSVADAPRLQSVTEWVLDEATAWSETLVARSVEDPGNPVTWELVTGPAGLRLTSAGAIAWLPTETAGPGEFLVRARLMDRLATTPAGEAVLRLLVREVNQPPRFSTAAEFSFDEETVFEQDLAATDPDLPANRLWHRLLAGPAGLTVSDSGTVRWQPTEAQGPGIFLVAYTVTDEALPPFTRTNFVRMRVREVPRPPVVTDFAVPFRPGLALRLPAAVILANARDPEGLPVSLVPGQFRTAVGTEVVVSTGGVAVMPLSEPVTDIVPVDVSDGGLRTPLLLRLYPVETLAGELRRELPVRFRPGQVLEIGLNPPGPVPPGTIIRETLPPGWIPERIPAGAVWRADRRILEWAAMVEARTEPIHYRVLAGADEVAVAFAGETIRADLELAIGGDGLLPASPAGQGQVTRLLPADFVAGEELHVVLRAEPSSATDRWNVREIWPADWTLVSAGPGWIPDIAGRTLTASHTGSQAHELTYRLRAPAQPQAAGSFAGTAEFDGIEFVVGGKSLLPFNRPPPIDLPGLAGREDEPVFATLPATDADGDALAWTVQGMEGVVAAASLVSPTTLRIQPREGEAGSGGVLLSASDGRQGVRVLLSVRVAPVNDPPQPVPGDLPGEEDRWLRFQLVAVDPENEPVRFRLVRPPAHGQVDLNSQGAGTYRPAPDFHGEDTFEWVATDPSAESVVITSRIIVAPSYDAPRPKPDTLAVPAGEALTLSAVALVANDDSPDGAPLRVSRWAQPERGELLPAGPDRWSLALPAGFSGSLGLQCWVSDGVAEVPCVVLVTVAAEEGAGKPRASSDLVEREFALSLEIPVADLLGNDVAAVGELRLVGLDRLSRTGARLSRVGAEVIRLESGAPFAEDGFHYQVEDDSCHRAWGRVTIRLTTDSGRLSRIGLPDDGTIRWALHGTPLAPYIVESAFAPEGPYRPIATSVTDSQGARELILPAEATAEFFRLRGAELPGTSPVIRSVTAVADDRWRIDLQGQPAAAYRIMGARMGGAATVELASLVMPATGLLSFELSWGEPEMLFWVKALPMP